MYSNCVCKYSAGEPGDEKGQKPMDGDKFAGGIHGEWWVYRVWFTVSDYT